MDKKNRMMAQLLDETLPDNKVIDDISAELSEANYNIAHLKLGGDHAPIPEGTSIMVITKAFFKEYIDEIGFGTFRVMAALGSVTKKKSGLIEAEHGFFTLYYDDNAELLTTDFHTEVR